MTAPRTLLALGNFSEELLQALTADAQVADFELRRADNLQGAVVALATRPPQAVLVDLGAEDAEALCYKVRGKRRAADIAVFGLARRADNDTFSGAFRCGVDDVITASVAGSLSRRLVSLPADQSVPPRGRGDAVVADPDATRANLIGRILDNAGYDVRYAAEKAALRGLARREDVRLVIFSADLGLARPLVSESRAQGGKACWIVVSHPDDVQAQRKSVAGLDCVGVATAQDPAMDLLFLSNELGSTVRHNRTEPRLPHAAVVAFRPAGGDTDEYGYTYNVSAHGMYVRSLAPPLRDRIWIEIHPPGSDRKVRLLATVQWRRSFGRLGTATAPPGFGVRIAAGLGNELDLWMEAVSQLKTDAPSEAPPASASSPRGAIGASSPEIETNPLLDGEGVLAFEDDPFEDDRPSAVAVAIAHVMEAVPPTVQSGVDTIKPAPRDSAPGEVRILTDGDQPDAKSELTSDPAASTPSPALEVLEAPPSEDTTAPSPPMRTRKRRLPVALIAGAVLAGGVAGAYFSGLLHTAKRPSAKATAPAATAPRTHSALPSKATTQAPPPAAPAPSSDASAAPAPSASAAAPDGAALEWSQGYLIVDSSQPADVYANGVSVGRTNSPLVVKCGLRWVRLGEAPGPRWLSPGRTVRVECQQVTKVVIEPGP